MNTNTYGPRASTSKAEPEPITFARTQDIELSLTIKMYASMLSKLLKLV